MVKFNLEENNTSFSNTPQINGDFVPDPNVNMPLVYAPPPEEERLHLFDDEMDEYEPEFE